jgi:hypothetical protein
LGFNTISLIKEAQNSYFSVANLSSPTNHELQVRISFRIYFQYQIKFSSFRHFFLFLFLQVSVHAETVNVVCDFRYSPGYACNIRNLQFADSSSITFEVSGTHLPGHSNSDVIYIIIESSQTPFIITQLFATFNNAEVLRISSSGLSRIQQNAFIGGNSLRDVEIIGNPLRALGAHAFFGALQIRNLNLQNNQIDDINVDALYGLHALHIIDLSRNRLRTLPSNVFLWRRIIRSINLNNNVIEVLPGDIFQDNRVVNTIALSNNNINALGRDFIAGLNELTSFEILNNRCVDGAWTVGETERTQTIPEALEGCFRNYEALKREIRNCKS